MLPIHNQIKIASKFRGEALPLKALPLTDPLDAEAFYVNGGKMTVEVAHRVFCIKYGSIWVTDFKGDDRPRTIFSQWAYETGRQRV